MAEQVIRTITIRGTSEGLDKLTADIKKLAAAEQGLAVVSDDLTKSQLSLEQLLKRQTLRLDEAARAQHNYEKEVSLSARGMKQGLVDADQHAKTVELAAQRYGQATTSANNFTTASANLTKQTSRNTAEMLNLGRQVADVGVSLQAGQSLMTVGIQQGAQILDVFASSGRSVGEILGSAVGWAGRFAASTAGIITGVAGIAAGVLYMGASFAAAQREIDKTLSATGGASGMTRGGINRIGEQAAGGGMSVSQAREAATAFAATGKIYGENILSATKLTRDFALSMGVDAADATKMFAKALADPKNGALELNKQMNFLDATTLNYIRTLQNQGNLQGAQKAMMDAINKSVQDQIQYVGVLTKVWNASTNAASNFFDDVAKGAARVAEITTGVKAGGFTDEDRLRFAKQNQQTAQSRLAQETDPGASKVLIEALTQSVKEANAEVERLEKKLADVGAGKKLAQLSLDADAFTRSIIPSIAEVEDLTGKINKLVEAQAAGKGGPNTGAAITIAQAQLSIAQETLAVEQRKAEVFAANAALYSQVSASTAQQLVQLQAQLGVAQAVTGADQIRAQHHATIVQLLGTANFSLVSQQQLTNAIAIADAQRAIALAQVNAAAQVRLKDLQDEMRLIKAVDDIARERIQSEITLNKLLEQGVDYYTAQAVAAQELANATERRAQQEYEANRTAMEAAQNAQAMAEATANTTNNTQQTAYYVAQTADDVDRIIAANREIARTHAFLPSFIPTSGLVQRPDGTYSQFGGTAGGTGGGYTSTVSSMPMTESMTMTDELKKAYGILEDNTEATKDNTRATASMTDVLSPFYSSDPRRTHLGFRSFARGGIMTEHGELPLRQYQGGGMATSPQVAVFGEGSTPEAYVPIPSGRIPVELKTPANSNQRPINVTINVMGNASSETVAALRQTGFQKAQALRRVTG